jgi:hypothetical protein
MAGCWVALLFSLVDPYLWIFSSGHRQLLLILHMLIQKFTTNKCRLDSRRRGSRGLRRAGDFSRVCEVF